MARKGKIHKRRRQREHIGRPIRWRSYQQFCLIVCEDEKTEPAYFRQFEKDFPPETFFLRCVGTGKESLGVVESAIRERDKLQYSAKKEIDFVWVVFDKDDADKSEGKKKRFDEAFKLAAAEKIHIILSNEAFELWLLLHLKNVNPQIPLSRHTIYRMMETHIRLQKGEEDFEYEHGSDLILEKIAQYGDEKGAIRRASELAQFFKYTALIEANPSTQVYKIIEELQALIAFYQWRAPE